MSKNNFLINTAMESPLGQKFAIILYEENWINECSAEFKPTFYRVCVNNIFVFWYYLESLHSFLGYMTSIYQNISVLNMKNLVHFRF